MNVRVLTALVVVTGLLGAGWFVLRDAGLVAVQKVEVTGATGTQGAAIRDALRTAGEEMTTLHVQEAKLDQAVQPFAAVKRVVASTEFPHTLRVRVVEHVPVAALQNGGTAVPVAADGTVLPGVSAAGLPTVKLKLPPAGDRVEDRYAMSLITLLARGPSALRSHAASAYRGPRGLTVQLTDGPAVYFGTSARPRAKWAALVAVLASPDSRGTTAIDVRVPEHPAAAGLAQRSTQLGQPSSGN